MMQTTVNSQVEITDGGRSGSIVYRETGGEFSTWWELASGNGVIAFIAVPTPERWDRQLPWAVGRRDEILARIGSEAVRRKAPACNYSVEERFINILRSSSK